MDVPAVVDVFHSCAEPRSLGRSLDDLYGVGVQELHLHRDMIGSVYFLTGAEGRYVFKLFHHGDTVQALQSLGIIKYLEGCGYPVVPVIPALSGDMHVTLEMPEGPRTGVLYDFLEGPEPDFDTAIEAVGEQTARLHNLMEAYPEPLIQHDKEFFTDRYVDLMKECDCRPDRNDELEEYGDRLWHAMERLPAGFCHGDLHSGNMVEHLYRGYSRERTLSDAEASAIFDFIAIRHYELNATITIRRAPILGSHWLASTASFDEQYEWLMEWADLCERKRG